jgi:hypothetical protein
VIWAWRFFFFFLAFFFKKKKKKTEGKYPVNEGACKPQLVVLVFDLFIIFFRLEDLHLFYFYET